MHHIQDSSTELVQTSSSVLYVEVGSNTAYYWCSTWPIHTGNGGLYPAIPQHTRTYDTNETAPRDVPLIIRYGSSIWAEVFTTLGQMHGEAMRFKLAPSPQGHVHEGLGGRDAGKFDNAA